MKRAYHPETGKTYHIYSKSIYGYVIFPGEIEYSRMYELLSYYQNLPTRTPFSEFSKSSIYKDAGLRESLLRSRSAPGPQKMVEILAYCLMPTHIHLIVRQTADHGIQRFMHKTLNSFSQFFNLRHNRRGPLWQSRFGYAETRGPDHLEDRIDYVLNNPVKDLGLARPEDWPYSSLTRPLL